MKLRTKSRMNDNVWYVLISMFNPYMSEQKRKKMNNNLQIFNYWITFVSYTNN